MKYNHQIADVDVLTKEIFNSAQIAIFSRR